MSTLHTHDHVQPMPTHVCNGEASGVIQDSIAMHQTQSTPPTALQPITKCIGGMQV